MKRIIYFFLLITIAGNAFSQIGGTSTYQFITMQPNAKIAALGGSAISINDNDMNLAIQNPSLLRREMNNQITYNHVFLFDGISAGYAGYARHFDSVGTFSAGIQYINYGYFKKTSASGEIEGTFSAGEYNMHVGYGKTLGAVSVGGQAKLIYSALEQYSSYGIAIDMAGTYNNEQGLYTIAGVASNIGRQIKSYTEGNNESLPFNLQLGFSKRFKHNPFRFSVVANHLEKPGKLLYNNLNKAGLKKDLETGETVPETFNIGEKALAHLTFSGEILLGKTFYVALAYNHLKRWEMNLDEVGAFTGFSWGFGFKVSKIQVAYGSSSYFVGHNTNNFSFIFNLDDFMKKKGKASS